jgi:hypothetical protein
VLAVSASAAEELRQTLDEVPTDVAFRLVSSEDGFLMRLDSPSDQDRVIENEERMVLMVAPDIDEKLNGAILDLEGEDQPKLTLRLVEEPC